MKVRYNKGMGVGFLVLGIIDIVLGCLTGGGGRNPFTLLIGFFITWFGTGYLTRPYFSFDETKLEVYDAFMGSMIAKYEFQTLNEIEVEKGPVFDQVFLKHNGEHQRMKISTWMVDKKDWQMFLQKINTVS